MAETDDQERLSLERHHVACAPNATRLVLTQSLNVESEVQEAAEYVFCHQVRRHPGGVRYRRTGRIPLPEMVRSHAAIRDPSGTARRKQGVAGKALTA